MTLIRARSALALALCAAGAAFAQTPWKPEKPVEIIVPTGAAGINDANARLIQKTLTEQKLVASPVLVLNKPGGNQSLAAVYMGQHANDPHYLFYATATLLDRKSVV